jgi:hypothetical protein
LPDIHTPDIGIFGPYAEISDEEQGDFFELLDINSLDIGILGPYAQIPDEEQGDFS